MPIPEQIAFAEFVRRKELRPGIASAFEADLRGDGATAFNYRTEAEWESRLSAFNTADRRRRS